MKKKNKVWEKCKNFFKILVLLVINFFLLFFPDKKEKKVKEEKVFNKNEEIIKDKGVESKKILKEDEESSGETRNLFTETYVSFFSELEIRIKIQKTFEKEAKVEISNLTQKEKKEYKELEKKILEKVQEKEYKKNEEKELDFTIKHEVEKVIKEKAEKRQAFEEKQEEILMEDKSVIPNVAMQPVFSDAEIFHEVMVKEEKILNENPMFEKKEQRVLDSFDNSKEKEKLDTLEEENLTVVSENLEEIEESVASRVLESTSVVPMLSMPLLAMVNQELDKERLEEKNYEHLEEKITLQETQLRVLFHEEKDEVKKEQVKEELKKIEVLKEDVNDQKKLEMEEENREFEEKIPVEEKELVLRQLKELQEKQGKEMEEGIFKEFEGKSEEQIKNIEKILVKERIQSLARGVEIPLLLSFPFIKNKYFRFFTTGLFLHNHLSFLRNLLWRTPRNYAKIDLSSLHRGKDALKKSQEIIVQNILTFSQIEQDIFSKYPELKDDEEFLSQIDAIKVKLYTDYFKVKRKKEKMAKNLEKIKGQTRKLKRKTWKE